MKIIHSADIHLGSKIEAKLPKDKADIRKSEVRQAFNKMVSYAALHDIKVIMISGDLFDSVAPLKKDKDYFYSVVRNNPDIDFIYLRGNHDSSECYSENIPENLKTFSDEWTTYTYGHVSISGIELTENNCKNAGYRLNLPSDTINIVMLHGQHDKLPINNLKNADYVALGHLHTFAEIESNIRGKCVYSGCLEGRGFDEAGTKGFVVVDTDKISYKFIPNSIRVIENFTIDVSKARDSYEAYKIIKNEINTDSRNLCRIEIFGEIIFDGEYLASDIEEYLSDDYFFVYVKDETTQKSDFEQLAKENSLKGEFVRTVLASGQYTQKQKERIISVGIKAFRGQGVLR